MARLALTRHGQSVWNLESRFTGWVDVDLTEKGQAQARKGGQLLREAGFGPKLAFTSVLKRAIHTLNIGLDELDRIWIPVEKTWRLNERHYGALSGLNKQETIEKHGADQVHIWRRSFDIPPPPQSEDHPYSILTDPRYAHLDKALIPASESLASTLQRVRPVLEGPITHALGQGDVLVSAHGNSIRAMVKLMFGVSDEDITQIEIPTGNPLLIELDGLKPLKAEYVDAERAQSLPDIPS